MINLFADKRNPAEAGIICGGLVRLPFKAFVISYRRLVILKKILISQGVMDYIIGVAVDSVPCFTYLYCRFQCFKLLLKPLYLNVVKHFISPYIIVKERVRNHILHLEYSTLTFLKALYSLVFSPIALYSAIENKSYKLRVTNDVSGKSFYRVLAEKTLLRGTGKII